MSSQFLSVWRLMRRASIAAGLDPKNSTMSLTCMGRHSDADAKNLQSAKFCRILASALGKALWESSLHKAVTNLLNINELSAKLGFTVSVGFIIQLGFKPIKVYVATAAGNKGGTTRYWDQSDLPAICRAIATYLEQKASQ